MSVSVDYTGRANDLFIFQGAQADGEQVISLTFGDIGQITAGLQKMAQTFTLAFLTELGTQAFNDSYGSEFMTDIRTGAIQSEADIEGAFVSGAGQAVEWAQYKALQAGLPADETLESVNLDDYFVDGDQLLLYLTLTSAAGGTAAILLPVPVAIK